MTEEDGQKGPIVFGSNVGRVSVHMLVTYSMSHIASSNLVVANNIISVNWLVSLFFLFVCLFVFLFADLSFGHIQIPNIQFLSHKLETIQKRALYLSLTNLPTLESRRTDL